MSQRYTQECMKSWLLRHGKACPVCRYVHPILSSFPWYMHLAPPVFLSTSMHSSASRCRSKIRIRLCNLRRSFNATPFRSRAARSSITPLVITCFLKSTRWKCAVAMGRRSIRWCATSCTSNLRTRAQRVSCSRPGRIRYTVRIISVPRIGCINDSIFMI